MCLDLFSEETPYDSILVNDHLPEATAWSLHFGWSLTGGSTVAICYRFSFIKVKRNTNFKKEKKNPPLKRPLIRKVRKVDTNAGGWTS